MHPLIITAKIAANIRPDWKTSVSKTAFIPPIVE